MSVYALDGVRPVTPPQGRCWVAPSASVVGNVTLGEDCGIWFGAVLRGDNERIGLGARVNIQEGATLHTDIGFPLDIGEDCTIGHNAILHGCVIGAGSLVGMGAIILNGARIGANCLVGAGALVTEGKTFPIAPSSSARPPRRYGRWTTRRSPASRRRPRTMSRTGVASPKAWLRSLKKERPAWGEAGLRTKRNFGGDSASKP
jgi:carbonic anhydrase/acetyltransferase-like protein (isoleucine patch superfamily)